MEDRWRPKSGADAGEAEQGSEAVERYGRGEQDPVTGLYEWYEDIPTTVTTPGTEVSWAQIFEAWTLVEADFQQAYGIDLERQLRRSWRWFAVRCTGLLSSPDTRLYRHFAATQQPEGTP